MVFTSDRDLFFLVLKMQDSKCPFCGTPLDGTHLAYCSDGIPRCPVKGLCLEERRRFEPPSSEFTRHRPHAECTAQTEIVHFRHEPRTVFLARADQRRLSSRVLAKYRNLRVFARKVSSGIQSNFRKASTFFKHFQAQLALPDRVVRDAWWIYEKTLTRTGFHGQSIEQYVAGAVFLAGKRDAGGYRSKKRIVSLCRGERTCVNSAIRKIKRMLDASFRASVEPTPRLTVLATRVVPRLGMGLSTHRELHAFLDYLDRHPRLLANRRPLNRLAGAIAYFFKHVRPAGPGQPTFTQARIASACGASVAGLQATRRHYRTWFVQFRARHPPEYQPAARD